MALRTAAGVGPQPRVGLAEPVFAAAAAGGCVVPQGCPPARHAVREQSRMRTSACP